MGQRKLYINTIGCQMNVYDSEQIVRVLATSGYTSTAFLEDADLVMVNTCAIRAKAEQKAFSFIGRLAKLKQQKPDLIVAVAGCVAQQEGEKILSRMPIVDIVLGTQAIPRLPGLLEQVAGGRRRLVDVAMSHEIEEIDAGPLFRADGGISRFITIMQGCDNFCSYCVVPYTRGREMSRHPERIVAEIQQWVEHGTREVTLLGQNVNSYGLKEGLWSFPELLKRINAIGGLERIRFTTSHPKDLSEELIGAFARLEKLCPHIHLPVQSGSDRILKRMNRRYDRRTYLNRIERLRSVRPDIAITSDIIVGFPGETMADFEATLDLMKTVRFDGLFAFMYSDRAVAPASRFDGQLPEVEKQQRLQALLALQEDVTVEKNTQLLGSVQRILLEESNPRIQGRGTSIPEMAGQWTGRTESNKIVNFSHRNDRPLFDRLQPGILVDVEVERVLAHSLQGTPVAIEPSARTRSGGIHHVA
ncbi:MAG: tRNA (N6-isopentenyl adenosine(37)-C2)-methylthiotransferase MiaB [Desulfobacterales bacterium]